MAGAAVNGKIIPLVADVTSRESLTAAAAAVRAKEGTWMLSCQLGRLRSRRTYILQRRTTTSFGSSIQTLGRADRVVQPGPPRQCLGRPSHRHCLFACRQPPASSPPRPKSQVIIISCICAFTRSPSFSFAYVASKAAATQMAKQLATTLAPYKIRVNTIAPGMYPTEMIEGLQSSH